MNKYAVKYRGKRKADGKYIYGAYFELYNEITGVMGFVYPYGEHSFFPFNLSDYEIEMDSLRKFTGEYDDNGCEIYEEGA